MQVSKINTSNSLTCKKTSPSFGKILRDDLSKKLLGMALDKTKKDKGLVVIFTGPSGVGKDTIVDKLLGFLTNGITCTDRYKRAGEKEGVNYFYLTKDSFQKSIEEGDFLEHVTSFSGSNYGTRKSDILNFLKLGKPVALKVDVDGEKVLKDKLQEFTNVVSIFIKPPSIKTLEERLIKRGTETPEQIRERVAKASHEMSFANRFDAEIENNEIAESVNDVKTLLAQFIHTNAK